MRAVTLKIGEKDGAFYPVRLVELDAAGNTETEHVARKSELVLTLDGAPAELSQVADLLALTEGPSPQFPEVGRALEKFLFEGEDGEIGKVWREMRGAGRVRTRLHLPDELRSLPWELLWPDGSPYALQTSTPIVRSTAWHELEPEDPWPLRLLVVVGSDDEAIKAEDELRQIRDALRPEERLFDLEVTRPADRTELQGKLESLRPHVVHFIGHGGIDPDTGQPRLKFGDGQDSWSWTRGRIELELGNLASYHPRLVVLNACRTFSQRRPAQATAGEGGRVLSIAEAFLASGCQAVLAMQGDIRGELAGLFAGELYSELTRGATLDVATAKARYALSLRSSSEIDPQPFLPTLTLNAPPEHVLPPLAVDEDLRDRLERTEVLRPVIQGFVNRRIDRRELYRQFFPFRPDHRERSVVVVRGKQEAGKTWLTQWCLDGCARRGHAVRYVSLVQGDSINWVEALRAIRGRPDEGSALGPLGEALPEKPFRRFNDNLNRRLRGDIVDGSDAEIEHEVRDELQPYVVDRVADNFFDERTCKEFLEALAKAGKIQPLILVLDQFDSGSGSLSETQLRPLKKYLLEPIARGEVETVRVVLVLSEGGHDASSKAPNEIRDLGFETWQAPYGEVVLQDLEASERQTLAREHWDLTYAKVLEKLVQEHPELRAAVDDELLDRLFGVSTFHARHLPLGQISALGEICNHVATYLKLEIHPDGGAP